MISDIEFMFPIVVNAPASTSGKLLLCRPIAQQLIEGIWIEIYFNDVGCPEVVLTSGPETKRFTFQPLVFNGEGNYLLEIYKPKEKDLEFRINNIVLAKYSGPASSISYHLLEGAPSNEYVPKYQKIDIPKNASLIEQTFLQILQRIENNLTNGSDYEIREATAKLRMLIRQGDIVPPILKSHHTKLRFFADPVNPPSLDWFDNRARSYTQDIRLGSSYTSFTIQEFRNYPIGVIDGAIATVDDLINLAANCLGGSSHFGRSTRKGGEVATALFEDYLLAKTNGRPAILTSMISVCVCALDAFEPLALSILSQCSPSHNP